MSIPQKAAQLLGLSEGSEVFIALAKQGRRIRRAQGIRTLDDLLQGVTRRNCGGEIDYGAPRGREVW